MPVSGQDLLSDAAPHEHTVIDSLAPSQSEQVRKEQLEAFARMFTFRFFEGNPTEKDWRDLADCIRRDCKSKTLLGFYLSALRKAPDGGDSSAFAVGQLLTLASEFPHSVPLNLSAGEILIGRKEPRKALPFLKQAFEEFLHDPAAIPQPDIRRAILSQYLMTLFLEREKEELDRAANLLESAPLSDEFPAAAEVLLIVHAAVFEQEPAEPLTFFGPVRGSTLALQKKLDDSILRYFGTWEKASDPSINDRLTAAIIIRAGYGDRLLDTIRMKYLDTGRAELLLMLADVSGHMGRKMSAVRYLECYLASVPTVPLQVVSKTAGLLHAAGEDVRAAELLKRYEGRFPPHPALLFNQIEVYSALRDWKRAMKAATSLPGKFERAYFQSVILQAQGAVKDAYAAACRAYQIAVRNKMKFNSNSFFYHFCILAEKCGDVKAVDALLSERIKLSPDDPELLNFLGYTLADHGKDLSRAEKLIEKALKLDPESGAILDSMAWVLFRLGRFAEAKQYILKAIEKSGDDTDAVIMDHAGDIFSACGDAEAAVMYWKEALELPGEAKREKIREKLSAAGHQNP